MSSAVDDLDTLWESFMDLLRQYYFTGGMPEAVQAYVDNRLPPSDIRAIQKTITADYAMDISKHAPKEILGRTNQVWNSIPQQLVKQNRKSISGDIQKGIRTKDFELAMQWFIDAGMIAKVPRVRKAGIPLKYYEDFSAFKLFLSNVGLMADARPVRVSMSPFRKGSWMVNMPLYAAFSLLSSAR